MCMCMCIKLLLVLLQFDVVCWEQAHRLAIGSNTLPPVLAHKFNVGDNIVFSERNLIIFTGIVVVKGNSGLSEILLWRRRLMSSSSSRWLLHVMILLLATSSNRRGFFFQDLDVVC